MLCISALAIGTLQQQSIADLIDIRVYGDKYKQCDSRLEAHFEGVCSSSWAISVASAANDEYCASNVTENKLVRFSAQNIMECCSKCFVGFDNGCYGGNFVEAMDFLVSTGAVIGGRSTDNPPGMCKNYKQKECYLNPDFSPACADADLDMTKAVDACTKTCPNQAVYDTSIRKIKGKSMVGTSGQTGSYSDVMKKAVSDSNILVTEMVIFEDLYAYKKGDIYVHLYGRSVGSVVINIIGYGTDQTTKQDYWLVRIPWGKEFGDNGVIMVQRGTNNCGIESPNNAYYFTFKN